MQKRYVIAGLVALLVVKLLIDRAEWNRAFGFNR